MRILLFTLAISLGCNYDVSGQEVKTNLDIPVWHSLGNSKINDCEKSLVSDNDTSASAARENIGIPPNADSLATEFELRKPPFVSTESERRFQKKIFDKTDSEAEVGNIPAQDGSSQAKTKEKFHWKPALIQSGIFLGIQHGFRMTQAKTRRELGGKFFKDWAQSVKNLRGWRDGDNVFTNYVAHPLQGGLTGRIFVNNSDRAKKQEFGKSKAYWASRFKAMLWSAAWDAQFELGPISEASIGNVGLRTKNGYSTMAYVDLVITPTVGTGVLIGEDAIDKYVLKNWLERKVVNKTKLKLLRSVLTPTTTFTNLLRGRAPWKRDFRPL